MHLPRPTAPRATAGGGVGTRCDSWDGLGCGDAASAGGFVAGREETLAVQAQAGVVRRFAILEDRPAELLDLGPVRIQGAGAMTVAPAAARVCSASYPPTPGFRKRGHLALRNPGQWCPGPGCCRAEPYSSSRFWLASSGTQKQAVHHPECAIGELERRPGAVRGRVVVDRTVREAAHCAHRTEEHFEQVKAVTAHVMSEPPPPRAGSCRHAPGMGGYQQES